MVLQSDRKSKETSGHNDTCDQHSEAQTHVIEIEVAVATFPSDHWTPRAAPWHLKTTFPYLIFSPNYHLQEVSGLSKSRLLHDHPFGNFGAQAVSPTQITRIKNIARGTTDP